MASWQSGYVEANGLRLHYTRTGGAKPVVVLAHGFSDDGLCWTPVAQALEVDYDLVMMDARGHGLSDAPPQGYGVTELADDLAGAIRALGLERPAILGHSMGGATTLKLAGTYPELPGAILIEDAGARNAGAARTPEDQERQARMRAWITGLRDKTRAELIATQHAEQPLWSQAELSPWADSKLRLSPNVLNRLGAAPIDWEPVLKAIRCPALLITADPERGAMVTTEAARDIQTIVPQLRVAHIPGAGHNVRREQFVRYVEVVRGFLAGL